MSITIRGLDELIEHVGGLLAGTFLRDPTKRSLLHLGSQAGTYPQPPPPGWWAARTSNKQKRAFFAKLRAGGWSKRTGTLGRRWTDEQAITVSVSEVRIRGVLGNNTSYGPVVMGKEDQAYFHKGRWPVVEDIIDAGEGDVQDIFEQAIQEAIEL